MIEVETMMDLSILGSLRKRALFAFLLIAALLLTLAAGLRYATPLEGIPDPALRQLNSGWSYRDGDSLLPLEQLPCRLDADGDTLELVRQLSDTPRYPGDVLVIQTRYQSIRVWADEELIYEAAQGREHALSSMWHFIPAERYADASALRVQLTRYDAETEWQLSSVIQDHPDAVSMALIGDCLPTILVWLFCMLFTLLLGFVILFMAIRNIAGKPLVLSLTAFIFLAGMWILLDSKITTVMGGNYALTYFFSYLVFYLLPIPLLCYFQLMLELKSRFLHALIWITAANAGLWMLLHLLNVVPIRNTAWSVHLIIILFLTEFVRELFWKRKPRQGRLVCTFWGMLLILALALASIVLYHAGLLPPANSAVLFVWGLLALILCMIMDTVITFGRVWMEKRYVEVYRQLATEDSMTGLYNRNAYELRLQELVSQPPEEVCLILFDIDGMKHINDTYGHHAGDQAISLAAQCIREVFGTSGGCYRIGGDEFCVILTQSCEIPPMLRQFDKLIQQRNQNDFPVSVSHGWEKRTFQAGRPVAFRDVIQLKTDADEDLYRNKKSHGQE